MRLACGRAAAERQGVGDPARLRRPAGTAGTGARHSSRHSGCWRRTQGMEGQAGLVHPCTTGSGYKNRHPKMATATAACDPTQKSANGRLISQGDMSMSARRTRLARAEGRRVGREHPSEHEPKSHPSPGSLQAMKRGGGTGGIRRSTAAPRREDELVAVGAAGDLQADRQPALALAAGHRERGQAAEVGGRAAQELAEAARLVDRRILDRRLERHRG